MLSGKSEVCSTSRLEPRPGQLPASPGPAAVGEALVADDVAREVDQDRGESCHAFALHHLPDGGGCCAEATVPDDPGTDTTVATARAGAGMTVAHDETANARGGRGDGSPAGAPHARLKGVSCTIMVRWQTNAPLRSRKEACECPNLGRIIGKAQDGLGHDAIREIPAEWRSV